MADVLDGIARHLAAAGLLTYDPTGVGGDCFIESMPPAPDAAVCLSLYDGPQPEARDEADTPRLQIRVRGGPDPRVSRARCTALYRALHGLTGVVLPDGTWLILAAARGTPAPMGTDSTGRHEHVVNFDLDVTGPTP
ncbi:minor capsid protein [Streptomyces salyersiae]|uniref:Minor capsid protein n=1 Tax=Streptomyces salyersiae TaxID=3075530 RepID=A0ABU2RVE5_9ACTN|nr:minor capsid protein [Streptomyces sp. DSM 41770]MDT0432806.1 minor capsid protein [Streptomyces sp. DSM 41770]